MSGRGVTSVDVLVFDSSALIAFLRKEAGGEAVAQLLIDHPDSSHLHFINAMEIFYDFHRSDGEAAAQAALQRLTEANLQIEIDHDAIFWQSAARLKSVHRRVSLADCLCIALAQRLQGTLITADHHEFDSLVPFALCPIHFIR